MAETTFTLWRQRLGYGIADLSCNLVWQMISLYLMFFYTDVMGLPAYYVGLMFLVTRLVDGVADVLMGLVIDNTATRWGRCRPYLLIGAIPFGLLCILAFYVPDFGTTGKLIYAFVTYLCLSFLYTLVNIPFCAMLPFLTNDSRERTTRLGQPARQPSMVRHRHQYFPDVGRVFLPDRGAGLLLPLLRR